MSEAKMNLHKDEGAFRIMEALSAVDEELLERSGMPVTDMPLYKKGSRRLWRYGRMAVACLAIVAVGAVSWGGLRLTRMITGDNEASGFSGGAQPGGTAANQDAAQEMITEGSMYEDTGVTNEEASSAEASGLEAGTGSANGESDGASGQESNSAATEEGIICSTPCPPDNLQIITEEQALETELGAYLPRMLPAGYSFESAHTDDKGQLYLCWTSGMDTIWLSVTYVEAGELETVDISRPETYDVRLYELPYGETVPREYWAVFNDPVFLEEDFSPEVVASRMKSYRDAGDTDTPSGKFSILYPDGILVGFEGDGSAEDIWLLLASTQE